MAKTEDELRCRCSIWTYSSCDGRGVSRHEINMALVPWLVQGQNVGLFASYPHVNGSGNYVSGLFKVCCECFGNSIHQGSKLCTKHTLACAPTL